MTCITGMIDPNGTVYMGGDAVSIQGESCVRLDKRSKVSRVGDVLIGSSGSHRVCQILEYIFQPPPMSGDPVAYMVKEFVPELRDCMKREGGEYDEKNARLMDGRCLVGFCGQLFEIDSGYGVFTPRPPYHAIGCAAQEALAGMFTAHEAVEAVPAREVVLWGLRAAAEFDAIIRPPFSVLSIPKT